MSMTASQPRVGSAPTAPSREQVRERIIALLDEAGVQWAWQGALGAQDRWLEEVGPADLDIWWRPGSGVGGVGVAALVSALCRELPAAPIADTRDPGRLRHTSLVVRTSSGMSVVDLTHGDLQVGPLVLVPEALVTVDPTGTRRLTGAAAVADLLLRPVLRGKVPPMERVQQARDAWLGTPQADRRAALARWRVSLGATTVQQLNEVLSGGPVTLDMVASARRRLVTATLSPRALRSSWRQRHTIVPAGRRATPLGLRGRGVVVALVGTDGSGKSTVARQLDQRLTEAGFTTSSAYFGMARGNLPGVALARRLLGVGGTDPVEAAQQAESAHEPERALEADQPQGREPGSDLTGIASAVATQEEGSLDRAALRRAAAWFYAAEYIWRYQRTVAPQRRRGDIVLVDRYVYDLRESPWPGSMASRVAERLVPRPDILVLPDAPDALIHARKPERRADEQAAIQDRYRRLLAERPARFGHVVVDTSGDTLDPVAELELAVISAAHRRAGESGGDAADTRQDASPR